jgi:membrane protease YdiL (CAAX protease family)
MTRNLTLFLLLAFGFSWLVALVGALLGIDVRSGRPYVIMAALAMFGPGIAAVVMQRVVHKAPWPELGLRITDTRWPMLVATALVGMAIVPLCLLVASVFGASLGHAGFGEVAVSHERMLQAIRELSEAAGRDPEMAGKAMAGMELPGAVWLLLIQASALLAALTINIPFMLGEELGWRGYLFHATPHFRGLHRVLFTGVTWGFWHAPLILLGHN